MVIQKQKISETWSRLRAKKKERLIVAISLSLFNAVLEDLFLAAFKKNNFEVQSSFIHF